MRWFAYTRIRQSYSIALTAPIGGTEYVHKMEISEKANRGYLEISLEELEELENSSFSPTLFSVKIRDKGKSRFTDCWVSARVKRGRVVFFLSHERGYPSENKGITTKTISASWLSSKHPAYNE